MEDNLMQQAMDVSTDEEIDKMVEEQKGDGKVYEVEFLACGDCNRGGRISFHINNKEGEEFEELLLDNNCKTFKLKVLTITEVN